MLQSLHIKNFQVHSDFHIEFDSSITTIVGSSDRGKSSILRALRWSMVNRPQGDSFIKHGTNSVRVALLIDGNKVIRKKGKGNLYSLNGKRFEAFGNDVPEEIAKLLNVGNENFQRQHDLSWWFSLSAGQVSKELNSIIALDVIDRTLGNISSVLRKAKATVEVTEERLVKVTEQRDTLKWVKNADDALKSLESKEKSLSDNESRQLSLQEIVDRMEAMERETGVRVPLKEMERLCAILERLKGISEQAEELESLTVEMNRVKEEGERWANELNETKVELEKVMKNGCPVCGREKYRS